MTDMPNAPSSESLNPSDVANVNFQDQQQAPSQDALKFVDPDLSKSNVLKPAEKGTQTTFAVAGRSGVTELLQNLYLPQECIEIISPCLAQMNLVLEARKEFVDRDIKRTHFFTVIHNNRDYRCLLFIPPGVSTDPDGDLLLALKNLIELMVDFYQQRVQLFVVYELSLDAYYKMYLAKISKRQNLRIDYIQNSEFRDMRDWPAEDQIEYLKRTFAFEEFTQPPTAGAGVTGGVGGQPPERIVSRPSVEQPAQKSWRDLKNAPKVVNRLVEIITNQAEQAPSTLKARGYLESKIKETEWPQNWINMRVSGLTGSAETDVRDLITYTLTQGRIGGSNLTALGSLLQVVKEDLGGDEASEVEEIIQEFKLLG